MNERWTIVETATGWTVKKYNSEGICYAVTHPFQSREAAYTYCKNRGFTNLIDR